MEQTTQKIVNKISKLKKEVPSDWAKKIAIRMNKDPKTIRAYSRGDRGTCAGYPLQVLKHLTEIHKEHLNEIEKLTA